MAEPTTKQKEAAKRKLRKDLPKPSGPSWWDRGVAKRKLKRDLSAMQKRQNPLNALSAGFTVLSDVFAGDKKK